MNLIELYSGKGTISSTFRARGHNTIAIDRRKRKGICEPDIRADIMQVTAHRIALLRPDIFPVDVVWASPVCTAFSYGAGDHYFHNNGLPKENAPHYIKLLHKTILLIEELNPVLYWIENPRGRMRYQKSIIDFLARTGGTIKTVTLSSYGFPTTKPTDIFTNAHNYVPRPMAAYGRGAKSPGKFSNLTTVARQATPVELAAEIAQYCETNLRRG